MYDLGLWLGTVFTSHLANGIMLRRVDRSLTDSVAQGTEGHVSQHPAKATPRPWGSRSVGISNLFSSQVGNVFWALFEFNVVWITPIEIVVVVTSLYDGIGVAGVIVASVVASFNIAKASGDRFEELMQHKNSRMKTTKEVLNAIQIAKLNASCATAIRKLVFLGALNISVLWNSPLVVSAALYAVVLEICGKSASGDRATRNC
ncbi:hypothetical protein PHYSODRAFT_256769 [Phytophthora sojae]|uniref:ABC transmembrane type-1 domain-containing protein n=1 Tax=Phytophthora sojae (strain P6497) TaxID=1094619 RepID=G4ZQY0_PHYSP|nr:hypothetical protein PHYSODRAFT_256769 [Phytophthora sojae]EGZ13928.1 hypothetical protein PHYSODRAFT_256769 [Phytophthora sojae]|eukprot:XP_009531357.1 hypothetical protein PHYSODRAFT_256769 [Phytophthora sojae]